MSTHVVASGCLRSSGDCRHIVLQREADCSAKGRIQGALCSRETVGFNETPGHEYSCPGVFICGSALKVGARS